METEGISPFSFSLARNDADLLSGSRKRKNNPRGPSRCNWGYGYGDGVFIRNSAHRDLLTFRRPLCTIPSLSNRPSNWVAGRGLKKAASYTHGCIMHGWWCATFSCWPPAGTRPTQPGPRHMYVRTYLHTPLWHRLSSCVSGVPWGWRHVMTQHCHGVALNNSRQTCWWRKT